MKKKFSKRTYHSLKEIARDMNFMRSNRNRIHRMMNPESLDEAFRERLMLAVTAVNGCRYCSYFHAKQALSSGVSADEIAAMNMSDVEGCPPEQKPAILYAQHWAETNAQPDPDVRQNVLAIYGAEKLEAMELALRMIRMGNLMGNSFDAVLFKLTFGYAGGGNL